MLFGLIGVNRYLDLYAVIATVLYLQKGVVHIVGQRMNKRIVMESKFS